MIFRNNPTELYFKECDLDAFMEKTGTAVSADPIREQAYDIQLGTEGCPVL